MWLFTATPPSCVFTGLASVVVKPGHVLGNFFSVMGQGLHEGLRPGRLA